MALSRRKNSDNTTSYQNSTMGSINSFANGTQINGEIKSTGDVRIDGKLTGVIDLKGKLVVGSTGFIDGEVVCANCDIQGKIVGKLTVTEQLSLKASAVVEGEVNAKKLSIEPGAIFNVTCQMNDSKTANSTSFKQGQDKKNTK